MYLTIKHSHHYLRRVSVPAMYAKTSSLMMALEGGSNVPTGAACFLVGLCPVGFRSPSGGTTQASPDLCKSATATQGTRAFAAIDARHPCQMASSFRMLEVHWEARSLRTREGLMQCPLRHSMMHGPTRET